MWDFGSNWCVGVDGWCESLNYVLLLCGVRVSKIMNLFDIICGFGCLVVYYLVLVEYFGGVSVIVFFC